MKIKQDYLRYINNEQTQIINFIKIFLTPSFLAIFIFRIVDYLFGFNKKFYFLGKFIMNIVRVFTGIEIELGAKIEGGFKIVHGVGVVIGGKSKIGENVSIYQCVTIGGNFNKTRIINGVLIEQPIIERESILCPGCKVFGPIIIKEGTVIGANKVVTKDL